MNLDFIRGFFRVWEPPLSPSLDLDLDLSLTILTPGGVDGRGRWLIPYLVAETGLDAETGIAEPVIGEVCLDTEPVVSEIEGKFLCNIISNDDSNSFHVSSLCNLLISWVTIIA
jgi:hypothetical protein